MSHLLSPHCYSRRGDCRETVVSRLWEPAGPILIVDLGGRFAPFLTALEEAGADNDFVLACGLLVFSVENMNCSYGQELRPRSMLNW